MARAQNADPAQNFYEHLRRGKDEKIRVIAEVKKASPSKGIIREDFDPVRIALEYEQSGASAISVLTEEDFFLGRREYLTRIRASVAIPLLRKDFIIEPYQVVEARALGADAFLLIVSLLTDPTLEELIFLGQELGMEALVEVHNEEELDRALHTPARIIGINNRDLKTFVTDIQTTFRLVERIPEGRVVVSESGIQSPEDLKQMERFGIEAVLVGEVLMRSPHPGEKLRELLGYEREA
jgi:indole-3-glycerol phosphate synthase